MKIEFYIPNRGEDINDKREVCKYTRERFGEEKDMASLAEDIVMADVNPEDVFGYLEDNECIVRVVVFIDGTLCGEYEVECKEEKVYTYTAYEAP